LILDTYREELDLEFRWLNEPPAEMIKRHKMYLKLKKRGANINYNEDPFKAKKQDDDSEKKKKRGENQEEKDS
jgi:hypothetical protein